MATLPRAVIDAYTAQLNRLSESAREAIAMRLSRVEFEDVADLREQVIEIMQAVCGAASDFAAATAAEFYDVVREQQVGAPLGAMTVSSASPEAVAGAVRALVQIVVDGKPWARFVSELQDRADYEVKRAAGECVRANAKRDPLKPKWARVPSGRETCQFCLMLASRGFAYASERTASEKAEGGHYHPNCDCRIVPGFEGMEVEGYDPDGMYRRWRMCAETVGRDPQATSDEATRAILRECATRDSRWFATGEAPEPTFATDALRAEIERSRPHELQTADRLKLHGVRCDFVDDSTGLADFASGAEIKTLDGAASRNTIESHLKSASKKKNATRVYFDNSRNSAMEDEILAGYIRESRRFKRGAVYVLDHDENLQRIR